jgi:tetratricopeptide (TPR) repeat protein
MKKWLKRFAGVVLSLLLLVLLLFGYFNMPAPAPREDVSLGMTFSTRYAEGLGLDWRETYLALLDEVGVKKMRLPVYWDLVESTKGAYNFSDVDWQIEEASKRGAEVILAVGIKVPRWPECHIPGWVGESPEARRSGILAFIDTTVNRYKDTGTIVSWQIENEPFLRFGICPPFDVTLLDEEIALTETPTPSAYYVRGLIKGFAGDYEGAAADYETYLRTDPTNWAAINDYAWVLLKADRPADALVAVDWGLVYWSANPWLLNSKATAHFELGQLTLANEAAERAVIAAAAITETDWLRAYPGNDPLIAPRGVAALKTAVAENMHTISLALEKAQKDVR